MKQRMRKMARFSRSTIAAVAGVILLCSANAAYAQSGTLGSASSPVMNTFGRPMGGVNVSVCQPLATTAASVTSNLAVLTMASNPITAGFAAGMTIQVSGFSGGDTYFNGGTFTNGTGISSGYTILSVTSTTITYSLTHANGTAATNGTALQIGNATTPCGGLSLIYTDPGLTQLITQPIVTDGLGNWNAFVAQSGQTYYVQFYGAGVTTSMRWMVVSTVVNAAVKPAASDAVEYVSPNGNDANDGFSLGTAKLTIYGGYNALPSTGGTIYVSGSGVQCTPVGGQGLGIAGATDPNYASIPTVLSNVQWVRAKSGVNIQGISATGGAGAQLQNSVVGWATLINCGNASTPGFWLSGVTGATISRIENRQASIPVRVSIDSNGSRANGSNLSTDIVLDHDDFFAVSGGGPVMDVGGGITWLRVNDSEFENGTGQAATSNAASGVYTARIRKTSWARARIANFSRI